MSIVSMMPSHHLFLCRPLLLLPSILPSIRVFSNKSDVRIRWPKDWSYSFSISPSNEYSVWFSSGLTGLISLHPKGLSRLFPSTTVQNQILWCSAFFMVELSHPYMTTGKNIALIIQIFVGKLISLPLNMLFRFVMAFVPSSKSLLIFYGS